MAIHGMRIKDGIFVPYAESQALKYWRERVPKAKRNHGPFSKCRASFPDGSRIEWDSRDGSILSYMAHA